MMDTKSALQSIGDGEFETLATWYLRRTNPDLAGLIATGINDEGKPIACRVDGILCVPGSPRRCVAVASTTVERKRLAGKWLGNKEDRGDVEKALEEFQAWKSENKNTTFVLFLATNQWLGSDTALYRRTLQRGHEENVDVVIIEASILVDFLDHDSEGQYLRQEILGIDANKLSLSLLRQICDLSLTLHQRVFGFGLESNAFEIERDAMVEGMELIRSGSSPLIFLVGASGVGKSTLARQIARKMNEAGGLALWVPAEEFGPGRSLTAILLNTLRRFHPALDSRTGDDVLRLAKKCPNGLLLLVDDVNRQRSPTRTTDFIEALACQLQSANVSTNTSGTLRIVVPAWPSVLLTQQNETTRKYGKWNFLELHSYSSGERTKLVAQSSARKPQALRQLLDTLDGDPLLCGIASADLGVLAETSRSAVVSRIFETYLHSAATDAVRIDGVTATAGEFVSAVDALIALMLQLANPEPPWEQVRARLGDRTADLLHILAITNRIGWIEEEHGIDSWRWKHNRLRDAMVGRWLAKHAFSYTNGHVLSTEVITWLSDPGLAEALALAIAFMSRFKSQLEILMLAGKYQPLALAEILRLGLFPSESEVRSAVADGLFRALARFDPKDREFVSGPAWHILAKLTETNDPIVLEITRRLPGTWYVWAARLRNGDIGAGLEWLRYELARGDFVPCMKFPLLEEAIEALASLYDRSREVIGVALSQTVGYPGMHTAAITLAGYLAWQELARPAWDLWNALSDGEKLRCLVPIVWTLSRCGDASIQHELEICLFFARNLSDEERVEGKVHHGSDRYHGFMSPLWLATRWPMTPSAAQTWARVAQENADLCQTICFVLRGIDHPVAMEVYVRWSGERGGTLWDRSGESVDPWSEISDSPKVPVNPVTRNHLWSMIESEQDHSVRRVAFRFWKRSATSTDVEKLRCIASTDPIFDEILKSRLKFHDQSAIPFLIERMYSAAGKWLCYGAALYDQEGVGKAYLENLESAIENPFGWPEVGLRHLSVQGMTEVIREKRDVLMRARWHWLSLWRSDVPEALRLVQDAVVNARSDELEYFFSAGGFPLEVSQRMLDTLVPILNIFPTDQLEHLAELAVRAQFIGWTEQYLSDVLQKKRCKHFWLMDEDIVETLWAASNAVPDGIQAMRRIPDFFRLEDKATSGCDIVEVARRWLGASPTSSQLTVVATILAFSGDGDDLKWWQGLEPSKEDSSAHGHWENALYILKRRRWQSQS